MRHLRTITIIAALFLAAPAASLAKSKTIGSATAGTPTMNICLFNVDCTYIDIEHGPRDVVARKGTIVSWSVNSGSAGGDVQLRILRPKGQGKLKFVASSPVETVTAPGINTFPVSIKVKKGDVLALRNTSSGLYMAVGDADDSVSYFNPSLAAGSTGKPTHSTLTDSGSGQGDAGTPHLRLLLSAKEKY